MDFALTDEQQMLVETARTLFTKECDSTLVRAVANDPEAARPLFDRHLRDWVGVGADSIVDLTLFLVESGATVTPGPFLATAGLFAPLLRAVGHPQADVAADGSLTGTVAIAGPDGVWTPNHTRVHHQVIDAHLVDRIAVVVHSPFGAGVVVVPADRLERTAVQTMDLTRQVFTVPVPEGDELVALADDGLVEASPEALADAIERAALAVSAESVGATRWMLDATVAYAKERIQFDKPIGSFQAIQHRLVDAALLYEQAAAAVSYAAMAIDAGDPDRTRATHVAKIESGVAGREVAKASVQVHGGVGYTWEHDLHFRLRRAYGNDALVGTGGWHLDRLADLLFAV